MYDESFLKAKIVKQLDYLPETALKQIWDFIEFLTWRKKNREANSSEVDESSEKKQDTKWLETDLSNLGEYEPYDWQPGELDAGLSIEIDPEKGVVIIEE